MPVPKPAMFKYMGPALRVLREQQDLSQAAMARKARIGKSQLSKYESGRELPKLESLSKLLEPLNATPLGFFYLCSVLEKAASGEFRTELLETDSDVLLGHEKEARLLREMFDLFLTLFEARAETRARGVASPPATPSGPQASRPGRPPSASQRVRLSPVPVPLPSPETQHGS